jgi:hypothetical protein
MNDVYDIFEIRPDSSLIWRQVIRGKKSARKRLNELAALGPEFLLIYLRTDTLIASTNPSRCPPLFAAF